MQGLAGPITAVLVLHYFDPRIQGYYYTFGSLLALQIFIELGLSNVITTFAAHEWAALAKNAEGGVVGDQVALNRLALLTRYAFRWYLAGAAILLIVLLAAGTWFFGTKNASAEVDWLAPWILMCCIAAASFALTPAWALLVGCGEISSVNSYRLVETLVRSIVIWLAIALGAALWSAVFSVGIAQLIATCFLLVRYRKFFADLFRVPDSGDWSWRKEVAPLQMRVGVAWLSGYFAFSLFTPVTFYFLGATAAGQMGMTWAFIVGLSGLASTWVQVRSPRFASLVAQRQFSNLDKLAKGTAWVGTFICIAGGVFGIAILISLNRFRPDLAARLLPVGAVAVFVIAEILHQISMVQSTYLRAFKREPFLWISWGAASVIGLGTVLLTQSLQGYGPALSYLAGISVSLVWGTIVFIRYRREWTFPRAT